MLKQVLVTGGMGFIGRYVTQELVNRGIKVLSFDHTSDDRERHELVTYALGDIRNSVAVQEAMSHVDGFIHLAGVLGTQETIANPTAAIMTNIEGGLNVLEAASLYDVPGVNIAVGNHWETNPYSISKSTVERLAKMYREYRGVNVSSVRAMNAYGPMQSACPPMGTSTVRKIVPSFVGRALHGQPIQVYGDGTQIMDMVYVSDVATVLVETLLAAVQFGPFSETLEVGTGIDYTVNDVATAVAEHVPGTVIKHIPLRPGETPGAVVKADLGTLAPLLERSDVDPDKFVKLEDGIRNTVRYYRDMTGISE